MPYTDAQFCDTCIRLVPLNLPGNIGLVAKDGLLHIIISADIVSAITKIKDILREELLVMANVQYVHTSALMANYHCNAYQTYS